MFFKLLVILFLLILSFFVANMHYKFMQNQLKHSRLIAILSVKIEENSKTKMLPIYQVAQETFKNELNENIAFEDTQQLFAYIDSLLLDEEYINKVNNLIQRISASSSTLGIVYSSELVSVCDTKNKKYEEKFEKNKKTVFVIYPIIVLCLSILIA